MRARPTLIALARAANALLFLAAAAYCLLTYSSFAYQQFIRPRMVASLASFVAWHHLWHWLLLGVTALTITSEPRTVRGRGVAWAYLAAMGAIGLVMLVRPVLPMVENDSQGLVLAFAFLLPPIWLAAYDHLATSASFRLRPFSERRIFLACLAAGSIVWGLHAASSPFRFGELGDMSLTAGDALFGAATSLALHAGAFAALGALMVALSRAAAHVDSTGIVARAGIASRAGSKGVAEYWALVATSTAAVLLLTDRLVFAALSFRGPSAWLLALALAVALCLVWSGIARRLSAADAEPPSAMLPANPAGLPSAIEAWFSPVPGVVSFRTAVAVLLALPIVAFAAISRAEAFDWNFLVQNLCVVGVWFMACAAAHMVVTESNRRVDNRLLGTIAVVMVGGVAARGAIQSGLTVALTRPALVPEFVLDAYASVDPSFHLIRQSLWVEPRGSTPFFAFLRANTSIEHVNVAPVNVDFVRPLGPAPRPLPNIFLFVVDSLRRDYLSVYNPAVKFTPAFGAFGAENFVYDRAFTRYGGTGLSMPAIWAGGMLLHKEYVLPFQPMNALEKLLKANRYRTLISWDHITAQLLQPEVPDVELDHGREEMQYDLCATLGEIEGRLRGGEASRGPLFAHTRSLNLHVSKLRNRYIPFDSSYEAFQGPAAAAVHRMDGCFGQFIAFLKTQHLYDNSIVILTSDHGDSLGEARRWGHAYTLFPEVVRTPLLMHVPAPLLAGLTTDVGAVAFSTDITPTLYALLGYNPTGLGWAYGSPLVVPKGSDLSWRRSHTYLLASSYGPTYALLRNNGQSLYIADALNERDYAYDIAGIEPVRVGVTQTLRDASRELIQQRVGALAEMYHFTPEP